MAQIEGEMKDLEKGKTFLKRFNCSGDGLFLTYKISCEGGERYALECDMIKKKASQVVFHGIFGTYKGDLGVVGQTTNTANWYTREEMGAGFKKTAKIWFK